MFTYGSPFYLITVISAPMTAALIWFALRKKSKKAQQLLIGSIIVANILQHLFKSIIYPQYSGQGFTAISSAYNLCALLILCSPIAFFSKFRPIKNFIYFTGTVAGLAALLLPVWYLGCPIKSLGWDYFRYYICHLGLFLSSLLPLLFQHHKPRRREFWQVGTLLLLALCVIFLNDLVFMSMGLYPEGDIHQFYDSMVKINPFGMMGPPDAVPWVDGLVGLLSPSIFMGNNPAGLYVPILWYAIPLFVVVSLLCLAVFSLLDRKKK